MKSTLIMGILNVTPDSFSDGGLFFDESAALRQAERLIEEGADILDVGGESTRPGAEPVPVEEEKRRVLPLLEAISKRFPIRLSVDTRKYEVASAALNAGATIINDVSGGSDERMAPLIAQSQADFILMHMKGDPQTMQSDPQYPRGVVEEVEAFFNARIRHFESLGVKREKLWLDPGIGFGKKLEHNLSLLKNVARFKGLAGKVVIGTSRKSFLSHLEGEKALPMRERFPGTLASNLWALSQGATVFRVHEVKPVARAFRCWEAICESQ